jgi:Tol biopolymer transport system component
VEAVAYDLLDGATIMFLGDTRYLVDARARTSTPLPFISIDATLSPDGTRILYTSQSGSMIAPTGNPYSGTVVTSYQFAAGRPSWSPDGSAVIFARSWVPFDGPQPAIYRQPADGRDNPTVLSTIPNVKSGPSGPYGNYTLVCPYLSDVDGAVSMAPSGDVAFMCAGHALYTVNGSAAPRLLYAVPTDSLNRGMLRVPTWDPAGTRIAFFDGAVIAGTTPPGLRNELKVLDVSTGVITTIATLPAMSRSDVYYENLDGWSMCWLPGGTRIVFTMPYAAGSSQIYVVSASGGEPARLTMGGRDRNVSCAR